MLSGRGLVRHQLNLSGVVQIHLMYASISHFGLPASKNLDKESTASESQSTGSFTFGFHSIAGAIGLGADSSTALREEIPGHTGPRERSH